MTHAVIIKKDEEQFALIKTQHHDRAEALAMLCSMHLKKVMPGWGCVYSKDKRLNAQVSMHVDKDFIINKLREYEFPLPSGQTIEGELA